MKIVKVLLLICTLLIFPHFANADYFNTPNNGLDLAVVLFGSFIGFVFTLIAFLIARPKMMFLKIMSTIIASFVIICAFGGLYYLIQSGHPLQSLIFALPLVGNIIFAFVTIGKATK